MIVRSFLEITAMNPSEILGSTGGAAGVAFYSYGTNIVINNLWTNFQWSFYTGPLTQRGGAEPALANFLEQSSINFNREPFDIAPGSIQNVKGTITVNNFNHEAAVQAEIARIQSTESVYGEIRTANVSPRMQNLVGNARNLDAAYQTRSFLYGATDNYVEVKTGVTDFRRRAFAQASADAANLAALNSDVAGIRMLGQGMRLGGAALGVVGFGYDIYNTGNKIYGQVSAGNTTGAALSGGEFAGRWGGMAAGAAIGTVVGGPVGGFIGGIAGAYVGEQGVDLAYNAVTTGAVFDPSNYQIGGSGNWWNNTANLTSGIDFTSGNTVIANASSSLGPPPDAQLLGPSMSADGVLHVYIGNYDTIKANDGNTYAVPPGSSSAMQFADDTNPAANIFDSVMRDPATNGTTGDASSGSFGPPTAANASPISMAPASPSETSSSGNDYKRACKSTVELLALAHDRGCEVELAELMATVSAPAKRNAFKRPTRRQNGFRVGRFCS
jgi:hypothetical protein